jgi:hypothetical protein
MTIGVHLCSQCNSSFDLSVAVDKENEFEELLPLQQAIATLWNSQQKRRESDYVEGWGAAAAWAKRDDLLADSESPAYIEERDKRLSK